MLYRVRLTRVGVGKCPKRWGLSFQRSDKRAVEQNPKTVRRRHEETWPEIRAKAKADGGEILFADQVGIRSDQVTGRFDHKVHPVVDGHCAHHSKKVRDWLAAHPDDVELHFPAAVLVRAQPRRTRQRRP